MKWSNDAKGFGFITQTDGGEDVFCHTVASEGQEGQKVEFDVKKGPKGLQGGQRPPGRLNFRRPRVVSRGPGLDEAGLSR